MIGPVLHPAGELCHSCLGPSSACPTRRASWISPAGWPPADLASAAEHGITLIDVVAVNLYPFVKAAANPATPFEGLIEEIDIGGPSLVRAAAKNFRDVLVVVQPLDYLRLLAALDERPSLAFRYELMLKAFAHTAEY